MSEKDLLENIHTMLKKVEHDFKLAEKSVFPYVCLEKGRNTLRTVLDILEDRLYHDKQN